MLLAAVDLWVCHSRYSSANVLWGRVCGTTKVWFLIENRWKKALAGIFRGFGRGVYFARP